MTEEVHILSLYVSEDQKNSSVFPRHFLYLRGRADKLRLHLNRKWKGKDILMK